MQIVRVNRNQVQTLGPLGALPHLVSVEATHNELEEVLDISPKTLNLRSADLSFNRISQLRGTLEGYSNLLETRRQHAAERGGHPVPELPRGAQHPR